MTSKHGCAAYQGVRPDRCQECSQANRAREALPPQRVRWTQNAIDSRKSGRRKRAGVVNLETLNELIG